MMLKIKSKADAESLVSRLKKSNEVLSYKKDTTHVEIYFTNGDNVMLEDLQNGYFVQRKVYSDGEMDIIDYSPKVSDASDWLYKDRKYFNREHRFAEGVCTTD